MTGQPVRRDEPFGADPGAGGPADDAGEPGEPTRPPGYPEEVDPAVGPASGHDPG